MTFDTMLPDRVKETQREVEMQVTQKHDAVIILGEKTQRVRDQTPSCSEDVYTV